MKTKNILAGVAASAMLMTSVASSALAVEKPTFSDVASNAWYAEAITENYCHGLMSGVGNNQFAPEDTMTRAMVARVLYNYDGSPFGY